ncbi:F-box domain containing protein [Parasponia andersonii]|uniref:F-box domain containing protein n=1 Tax=Parasponia andersonii TaxID=3476 RepID=A0A2P5D7L9_PARAD|nr:F-box domain containing protein [Parasponia andersonii]
MEPCGKCNLDRQWLRKISSKAWLRLNSGKWRGTLVRKLLRFLRYEYESTILENKTLKKNKKDQIRKDVDDNDNSYRYNYIYNRRVCFLRKLLKEELGEDEAEDGWTSTSDHKLMAIAVHAVLLESGFVGFDPVSGNRVDQFHRLGFWPASFNYTYTLPQILDQRERGVVAAVKLEFESVRVAVIVSGSLADSEISPQRQVRLYKYKLVPILRSPCTKQQRHVVLDNEFWNKVKDELVLPLLIDLRAKAGLPSPPSCLMALPTELHWKILEFLPGVDVVKLGCTCKEFFHLFQMSIDNPEFWRSKFPICTCDLGVWRTKILWKRLYISYNRIKSILNTHYEMKEMNEKMEKRKKMMAAIAMRRFILGPKSLLRSPNPAAQVPRRPYKKYKKSVNVSSSSSSSSSSSNSIFWNLEKYNLDYEYGHCYALLQIYNLKLPFY